MAKSPVPLLLLGAAFLLLKSKNGGSGDALKAGPTGATATTGDGTILGGEDPDADATQAAKDAGLSQEQVDAVMALPPLQSANEVVFNEAVTEFAIGATWRYATLDKWLNQQRLLGWIETKTDEAPAYYEAAEQDEVMGLNALTDAALFIAAATAIGFVAVGGWYAFLGTAATVVAEGGAAWLIGAQITGSAIGMQLVDTVDDATKFYGDWLDEPKRAYMQQTAALALIRFSEEHYVLVGPHRTAVRIKDLPRTQATADFVSVIANYIVRFQASSYS